MPILTFCSQAYYPSVSSLKKLENPKPRYSTRVQWFYGYNDKYKDRLLRCNLLPVSLYIELHDVLYLEMILNGRADIKPSALVTINENESTIQGQRKEISVNSTRKKKIRRKHCQTCQFSLQYPISTCTVHQCKAEQELLDEHLLTIFC